METQFLQLRDADGPMNVVSELSLQVNKDYTIQNVDSSAPCYFVFKAAAPVKSGTAHVLVARDDVVVSHDGSADTLWFWTFDDSVWLAITEAFGG